MMLDDVTPERHRSTVGALGPETPVGATPDVGDPSEDSCSRPARRAAGRPRRPRSAREPIYVTADDAAQQLGMSATALRAMARRHARREASGIVARLGGGVVGVQLGSRRWRFHVEPVT